jgi:PAS domain S-box-containing protein
VLWTRGAERLYGFSKAEALGRVSHELFQTEFAEGRAHVDERLRSVGQWEGELVHRKRDGERLVVASRQIVYCDSTGRPVRILEVNADITERKRAEQGLRESQARFERVIDSAMDAIISIDETQRVVLFNAAAERMFGCAAAAARGHPLDRFIPERLRAAHRAHVRAFGATGVTSRAMGKLGDLPHANPRKVEAEE